MTAVYAVRADLPLYGANANALASVPTATQEAALAAASELADSYLRTRYVLPLLAWGNDLRRAVCQIATYDLFVTRGYNPAAAADVNYRMRYEDAIAWLKSVARQEAQADVVTSDTQAQYDEPTIITSPRQGW